LGTDSSRIPAIETRYAGCRFRSRLEARWARFFDAAEIEWKYEPEGFELDGVRYLPDFYLPSSETWVEVKGNNALLEADSHRLEHMLDYTSPIPGICRSWDERPGGPLCHGLLILGDVPRILPGKWGPVLHPLIQHHEGLCWVWAMFIGGHGASRCYGNMLTYVVENDEPGEWSTDAVATNAGMWTRKIADAYEAARSARFEHGESG